MRRLSEVGDPEALANRFLDRIILLVEGPGDVNGFRHLAGPDMLVDFEIKLPLEGQGGCGAVQQRVRKERDENDNKKVFGLLDGEAAAGLGAVAELLTCEEAMFQTGRADHEGLIFLSGHEFENLFFAHVDVCAVLASHCKLSRLDDGLSAKLSSNLIELTTRFFGAAMFKYTSLDAAYGNLGVKILDTWFFGTEPDRKAILQKAKSEVIQLGGDWPTFVAQLFAITRVLRTHVSTLPKDPATRRARLLRLADGKALLTHLRKVVSVGDQIEGHLLRDLIAAPYAEAFRSEVRRRTQ